MSATTATTPDPIISPVDATPRQRAESQPPATFQPHRLTLERYYRLVDEGFFGENEPIFLWRGQLVEKMTKGQPHNTALAELNTILCKLIPNGWHVRPQQPVALGGSVPEPDISIVRGRSRDYPKAPPTPRDVALIIEVADSSLAVDSGDVLIQYARYAIPVYWIVNLVDRRVEIHTDPTGPTENPTYRARHIYGPGEVAPVVLDGQEIGPIPVSDILP